MITANLIANREVTLYGLAMNWDDLTKKKAELDAFRPLPDAMVRNLEKWFLIELTYTSNAIEGNTLTRQETAVVVEKGLTVSGKALSEHLEATNHAEALQNVITIAQRSPFDLTERVIMDIHETILRGIDTDNVGRYRSFPVRISGSMVILPNSRKVPDLMATMVSELVDQTGTAHPVELAAEAHYQLVTIHPFSDGNGRTARLLMNLILLQQGYPPALIRTQDRLRYLRALEKAQLGGSKDDYYKIIQQAVARSFDIYLKALNEEESPMPARSELLKIGQLAKITGESNATLRFWVKEGLLEVSEKTESGYQLFSPDIAVRVKKIRELQAERYSLNEIQGLLSSQE